MKINVSEIKLNSKQRLKHSKHMCHVRIHVAKQNNAVRLNREEINKKKRSAITDSFLSETKPLNVTTS